MAEKKVKITVPRARKGEDANLYVGINGITTLIPRGKTVEVPPEVAAEVERSIAAENFMFDSANQMQKAAEKEARKVSE